MKKFTDKQQRFVAEYLIDQNATQAYRRAYPKCKTDAAARAAGARLLANVSVSGAVDAGLAELAAKLGVIAVRAWEENGYIATSNIGNYFDFTGDTIVLKPGHEIPESAQRAVKSFKIKTKTYTKGKGKDAVVVTEVETELTLWDKNTALAIRLKALGELDPATIEHTGKDGGAIQHTIALLDINTDEFKALPIEERIRQLREAVMATQLPAEKLIP